MKLSYGKYLLASFCIFLAFVWAVEKLSVEQLHGYHSENKMKQKVDYQDVENVLQRVDDAIEYSLEFGNSFYGFQRPQHSQDSQRFHCSQVLSSRTSTKIHQKAKVYRQFKMPIPNKLTAYPSQTKWWRKTRPPCPLRSTALLDMIRGARWLRSRWFWGRLRWRTRR